MHFDEEKLDPGLLEKYVLGLCNITEQKQIESLVAEDPSLAGKIEEMRSAVRCYCTSCYSDKIKSILKGKGDTVHCKSVDTDARLLNLGEDRKPSTFMQKVTSFLRSFLPFSGW